MGTSGREGALNEWIKAGQVLAGSARFEKLGNPK